MNKKNDTNQPQEVENQSAVAVPTVGTLPTHCKDVTIFLIILVIFILGAAVVAIVNARTPPSPERQTAWAHVAKLIDGNWQRTILSGSYQGRPVEIFLNDHGHELALYFYHLRLRVPLKGFDWKIYFDKRSNEPARNWYVKSDNEPLKQRLTEAGALDLVQKQAEHPQVTYRADRGTLALQFYVDDHLYVPTLNDLQSQLTLMTRLADLNEQLNVW